MFTVVSYESSSKRNLKTLDTLMKRHEFYKAVKRQNSPLFTSLVRTGVTLKNPRFSFDNRLKTQVVLDGDAYAESKDFSSLKNRMVRGSEANHQFLRKIFQEIEKECDHYLNMMRKLQQEYRPSWSYQEYSRAFAIYVRATQAIAGSFWPPLGPEEWLIESIQRQLKKYVRSEENFQSTWQTLIYPVKASGGELYQRSMVQMAAKIQSNRHTFSAFMKAKNVESIPSLQLQKALQRLHETYAWTADNYLTLKYYLERDTLRTLQSLVKRHAVEQYQKSVREQRQIIHRKQSLIRTLHLSKDLRQLLSLASDLPYYRLRRKEVIFEGSFMIRKIFRGMEKLVRVPDITQCYYFEIEKMLAKKPIDRIVLRKRKKGYGFVVWGSHLFLLNHEQAGHYRTVIDGTVEHTTTIKGMSAYLGLVQGTVKVLDSSRDSYKVKPGDILVTAMTMPDFVPVMKKAAAFVTDEGGISCHAAIVARELKKPCIIGTKIATKVFKDGDLVEVDADKGVVNILQKGNTI